MLRGLADVRALTPAFAPATRPLRTVQHPSVQVEGSLVHPHPRAEDAASASDPAASGGPTALADPRVIG
jgi:hypothetical protein